MRHGPHRVQPGMAQVPAAEAEIERVAGLLGAQPLGPGTGGKLETYIRRYCPEVLSQLVEAGVLQASANAQ
jgi:thiamine-triphosphatase